MGGGGGASLPGCVCPKVQGSDMSENISLKMGVKFAAPLNMGKNLC